MYSRVHFLCRCYEDSKVWKNTFLPIHNVQLSMATLHHSLTVPHNMCGIINITELSLLIW